MFLFRNHSKTESCTALTSGAALLYVKVRGCDTAQFDCQANLLPNEHWSGQIHLLSETAFGEDARQFHILESLEEK